MICSACLHLWSPSSYRYISCLTVLHCAATRLLYEYNFNEVVKLIHKRMPYPLPCVPPLLAHTRIRSVLAMEHVKRERDAQPVACHRHDLLLMPALCSAPTFILQSKEICVVINVSRLLLAATHWIYAGHEPNTRPHPTNSQYSSM